MAVILRPLHETDQESLLSMCTAFFLQGECYAFAIALHRGLGWPIVGLMRGEVIEHALIQRPDGLLHDSRGPLLREDRKLGQPFGFTPPYEMRVVSEKDLLAVRPVGELSIKRASLFAEALWPTFAWKGGFQEQVLAFAKELEELSRRHRIWIRATYPTTPPMI